MVVKEQLVEVLLVVAQDLQYIHIVIDPVPIVDIVHPLLVMVDLARPVCSATSVTVSFFIGIWILIYLRF